MATFEVSQKAEFYYVTTIEAETLQEAMEIAKDNNYCDWQRDEDTTMLCDEYLYRQDDDEDWRLYSV